MAQNAAYGTTLRIFDTYTALAYVTVAYVREISGLALSLDALDNTGHDNAGGARTFQAGLLDAGEATLTLHWDSTNNTHDVLLTHLLNRNLGVFQLLYPDTTQDNFTAYVTSFQPSAPVDDMLTATATLRLTSFPILGDTTGFDYLETEDGIPILTENNELILINNLPS